MGGRSPFVSATAHRLHAVRQNAAPSGLILTSTTAIEPSSLPQLSQRSPHGQESVTTRAR